MHLQSIHIRFNPVEGASTQASLLHNPPQCQFSIQKRTSASLTLENTPSSPSELGQLQDHWREVPPLSPPVYASPRETNLLLGVYCIQDPTRGIVMERAHREADCRGRLARACLAILRERRGRDVGLTLGGG